MSILFNKRLPTQQEVSPPILSFVSVVQNTTIDYNGSGTLDSTAQAINPSTGTAASGTLNYQWYRDGVAISGANSATLTLTDQTEPGDFYAVVTFTPSGSVAPAINSPLTSRTATTTIRNALIITKQPVNTSVVVGNDAVFACSAYVRPKSMVGFDDKWGDRYYFGGEDYNVAISLGFSDADIRFYLEQVYTGAIGSGIQTRLNDPNFGTSQSRNLLYEWYVDGVKVSETRGNSYSSVPGFNGTGVYLDLSEYPGNVLVEFNVTEASAVFHRINIPGVAEFPEDYGTDKIFLQGGRIYGPCSSSTLPSGGFIAPASEIGVGTNQRLVLSDSGGTGSSDVDDMQINIDKGFFKTYQVPSVVPSGNNLNSEPYNGIENGEWVDADGNTQFGRPDYRIYYGGIGVLPQTPPRNLTFSTVTLNKSVASSSTVYCKVSLLNVSGDLAPPSINSNSVTWTVDNYSCLDPNDSRKPGGSQYVLTNSGIKPGPVSVWFGPFTFGTSDDTCSILTNFEIRGIYPRLIGSGAGISQPFIAAFQIRIRGSNGGEFYNGYKVIRWGGNSASSNTNDRKNISLNGTDCNGQRTVEYADNGGVIFDRTAVGPGSYNLPWTSSWGRPIVDILLLTTRRVSDGAAVDAFLTINDRYEENLLEYSRRYDPYSE